MIAQPQQTQQPQATFQSASLYVGDLHNDVTEVIFNTNCNLLDFIVLFLLLNLYRVFYLICSIVSVLLHPFEFVETRSHVVRLDMLM